MDMDRDVVPTEEKSKGQKYRKKKGAPRCLESWENKT